jgi:hypothetical protein
MNSMFIVFAAVMGVLVTWWLMLIRGLPAVIRAAFERRTAQIQRELDEAVMRDCLPIGDPSVMSLSRTLDAVVEHSDRLTPAFSKMLNRVMNEHGRPLQVQVRSAESFANLSGEQRKIMHDLDRRLTEALTFFLNYGSPSGWFRFLSSIALWLRGAVSPSPHQQDLHEVRTGEVVYIEKRARAGDRLVSTRLAIGALLDAKTEPGLDDSAPGTGIGLVR